MVAFPQVADDQRERLAPHQTQLQLLLILRFRPVDRHDSIFTLYLDHVEMGLRRYLLHLDPM